MTQTFKIFGILLIILVGQIVNGQVDNLSKNSKLFDDEQSRFESELKTNKYSAEVYWKHANVTANFTFIAQKDAWKFYKRAIEIDSSKVIYFIDYGKYLHETLRAFDAATDIYSKGLRLFPDNIELNNGFDKLNKDITTVIKNGEISKYGNAPSPSHTKAADYTKITDFDNLANQTKEKESEFYYNKLLDKFNADIELTDEQVYMLLVGFTQQDSYKPYSEEYTIVYELIEQGNYNEAVVTANKLLQDNPLSVSIYKELMYAYRKNDNQILADNCQKRIQAILNAMLYTGDGSCDKPYVAFTVKDEYSLLKYINYERTGSVTSGTCAGQWADKIEVTNLATKDQAQIYFNIMPIFKKTIGK